MEIEIPENVQFYSGSKYGVERIDMCFTHAVQAAINGDKVNVELNHHWGVDCADCKEGE